MTKTNMRAYLAGIIDADGFISAHKTTKGGKRYCAPLVGISGTSSEPHLLAQAVWGGSVFTYVPKNPKHKTQYMWQAVGRDAAEVIKDIRPFILTKSKQIVLALKMWEMIARGVHRSDVRLYEIGVAISALNLRNPPRKPRARKDVNNEAAQSNSVR